MFGQQRSTPFGAPAATPFGSPAPAFGTQAPTTSAFGSTTSTFGAPTTTSAFGSSAPTTAFGTTPSAPSSGFGGFGSPAPAPAFGAPASTPFGAPASSTGGGLFGSTTPSTTTGGGGLFGGSAPSTTFGSSTMSTGTGVGLFGAPSPAPTTTGFGGFGSSATTTGFGASAPAAGTSIFGSPAAAPSGGLFGSAAPAPSGGGLFGSAAPAPVSSGGFFGSSSATTSNVMGGSAGGTTIAPYQETRKLDGTSQISFQSITAMSAYENKSFEELRMEDYMAGNKGSQGQAQPSGGFGMSFGAPAPSSSGGFGFGTAGSSAPSTGGFGGFGATSPTAPTFGSPSPATSIFGAAPAPTGGGLFGSTAPAPTGGGLFGSAAPAPTGGGLFGSAAPAPSGGGLFGSAPTPAPSGGGLFGSAPVTAPSGGLFGSSAPAPAPSGGGLFGSVSAPAPAGGGLFGSVPAPAPAGGGLFGSTTGAPSFGSGGGSLFGSAAPAPAPGSGGGLFGSTTPAPAPGSGGLFGSTAPAPAPGGGGLFGSLSAPSSTGGGLFGSPTPAPAPSGGGLFGSSFGAPKPATGGLFGAPTPAPSGGGLFGSTTLAPSSTSGGLFGGAAPAPSQTFGAPPTAPVSTPGATTILVPPSSETLLAQQMAAIENQNKELAVLEAWRGGARQSPKQSHSSVIPSSVFQRDAQGMRYRGVTGSVSIAGNGSSPSILSAYHAAPRSTAMIRPRGFKPSNVSIGSTPRTSKSILSPSSILGSTKKQLVIKADALTPKPKTRLILSDDELSSKKKTIESETPNNLIKGRDIQSSETPRNGSVGVLPFEDTRIATDKPDFKSPDAGMKESKTPESMSQKDSATKTQSVGTPVDDAYDFYRSVIGSPVTSQKASSEEIKKNNTLIPKLTKDGYVMTPSVETLSNMSEADLAAVPNFVVERIGFGSVAWDGAVDVRGIDLDSVVNIESKAVEVYHKQEEEGVKPPVGTKLNRPAILTLHNIYPKGGADASEAEKEKFERKIVKKTKEMGASLVLYDADIGVWKLHVEHFSRYALDDDSDEEDDINKQSDLKAETDQGMDFDSEVRGGRANVSWANLGGATRFHVSDHDYMDEKDVDNMLLASDRVSDDTAEAAYVQFCEMEERMQLDAPGDEDQQAYYHDDDDGYDYIVNAHVFRPPPIPISTVSICANIATECNITRPTSSATDFGLRMGKSFGICWRPDGSFLHPVPTSTADAFQTKKLMQSRPLISIPGSSEDRNLLEVHLNHSSMLNGTNDPPIFVLKNVGTAIDAYADISMAPSQEGHCNEEEVFETSHIFSLVSILFGEDRNDNSFDAVRQKEAAFQSWLRNLCSSEVESDVLRERGHGECYSAIFAALSGGDHQKASQLAQSQGHYMLALLIANASISSVSSLSEQMSLWNSTGAIKYLPPELVRIYSYLSNDMRIENTLFQNGSAMTWERRMMMIFKTILGQPRSDEKSLLTSLIRQYECDVKSGLAPPANSRCRKPGNAAESDTSTLFRIMKLFHEIQAQGDKISLLHTISPFGHSINPFDVSRSYHLAAILSAIEVCHELSEDDEITLIDTYAFQLQLLGSWEWAVYVCLCRLKTTPLSSLMVEAKKRMALEIIRKHYVSNTDSTLQEKRSFLENEVGVPTTWFEDALKSFAVVNFDIKSYLAHGLQVSKEETLHVYEEAVLPDIIFNGNEDDIRDIYYMLSEMNDDITRDELSFRAIVFDFIRFQNQVSQLLGQRHTSDIFCREIFAAAQSIQRRLKYLQEKTTISTPLFPSLPLVPKFVVFKELQNSVSVTLRIVEASMLGNRLECSQEVLPRFDYSKTAFSAGNDNFLFHQLDPRSAIPGFFKLKDPSVEINNGPIYRPSSFL